MKQTVSNDNTKKIVGFEYQKLIALEYCLNAKKGEHVYIECFGDVQHNNESIEVKHHEGESNLTSNSVDVWKTIKNIVTEYDKLKSNDRFILHTTQMIPTDSIFYNWNKLNKTTKYRTLNNHSISATSKPFKDIIFDTGNISKPELMDILDKFVIHSNEPKVDEKINQIKDHSTFKIIKEDLRQAAIGVLIQYLVIKAIDDSNKWEINISDFNTDLQFSLSKFAKDYIPFPSIKEPERDNANLSKGYKFIEKLNAISLKQDVLHQAFQDYIRSEEAYKEILKMNPTLGDKLVSYERDIKTDINMEKSATSNNLSKDSFSDNSHLSKSRDLYFKCILKLHHQIAGIRDVEKFFRDGRIQNINETTDFEWLFKETDL